MFKKYVRVRFPLLCEMLKIIKHKIYVYTGRYDIQRKKYDEMSIEEIKEQSGILYRNTTGKILDWNNLKTYTEKMQWAKSFDLDLRKVEYSDKYKVREYVKQKIGEEYLIPLYATFDKWDDIDFNKLPESFVIKTNCSSGDTCIIEKKSEMTLLQKLRMYRKINISLEGLYCLVSYENHYRYITPKIIVEELIKSNGGCIQDYKFICFNGVPYFCWIDSDRFSNHTRTVYNMNWEKQEWNQRYAISEKEITKPINFEKMIEIAKVLSKGFSHVRIDLYNVSGKIYFGEMTFTNGSGYENISPESFDYMLGNLWDIETNDKILS